MAEPSEQERNHEERPTSSEPPAPAGGDAPVEAEASKESQTSEIESLRASLEEEKGKAAEYLGHWQRSQADFINYKRRVEQERGEQIKYANAALIMKVLPVLDDFERAFSSLPRDLAGLTWLEGIALIDRKMRFVLEQEGVTPIEAVGKDFDPQLHEAVLFEEGADLQHCKVVAELQKGYKLHERVVRPTLVKVGQPCGQTNDDKEAKNNEAEANAEQSTGEGQSAAG